MYTTVGIRIVADCVVLFCQVTRKLKRATTIEFTTKPAIIFIHCCVLRIIVFQSLLSPNFYQSYILQNWFLLFSFIISIPNLRFVRVINCPNRIMNGLYNLQSLTESYLLQSAHELNPFSMQHGLTWQALYPTAHFGHYLLCILHIVLL